MIFGIKKTIRVSRGSQESCGGIERCNEGWICNILQSASCLIRYLPKTSNVTSKLTGWSSSATQRMHSVALVHLCQGIWDWSVGSYLRPFGLTVSVIAKWKSTGVSVRVHKSGNELDAKVARRAEVMTHL